jgi:hypothetical protein
MFGQLGRDVARKADDPRVRLESDASGGELHVRADVVGDDGRAQSFRRLVVHVAGPDGFVRDVPLEAVGAGRYAASVPLTRPGTYVALAKDEVTGEPVGTTGAVLTAGEELRPTGSDRALLARIATMTNGKVRDTLGGAFDDRAARRFAYKPMMTWLVLASALAMLLAVAARRLGMPAFVSAWAERSRQRREESALRKKEQREEAARQERLATLEASRLQEVLKARREKEKAAPDVQHAVFNLTPRPPPPPPIAVQPQAPAPPPPPVAQEQQQPQQPAGERPLTAAERLALKRRERK